jgi:hypothetical protein
VGGERCSYASSSCARITTTREWFAGIALRALERRRLGRSAEGGRRRAASEAAFVADAMCI